MLIFIIRFTVTVSSVADVPVPAVLKDYSPEIATSFDVYLRRKLEVYIQEICLPAHCLNLHGRRKALHTFNVLQSLACGKFHAFRRKPFKRHRYTRKVAISYLIRLYTMTFRCT